MPFYELLLVLRPMPKNEIISCLKRTAQLVWDENASLKKLEYLGHRKLPYKKRTPNEDYYHEGSYFLYHVSINPLKVDKIRPELKLDLDIIKSTWNLQSEFKFEECQLAEESAIPFFRPHIQALLYNKNVRLSRRYYSTMRTPGLLSIFENNPKRLERIQFLAKLFTEAGHELRIAGGAVRDILRGKEPIDIDFATTALPEKSLELLEKYNDSLRIITTATGLKHGTVSVKFKEPGSGPEPVYDDESPFEITTLRCDNITDGRHAEVQFIEDWKTDALRRDLTINSMFLTLDKGELVDFFGGESDLKNGIIRFVGNADDRIKEDYLRILRYFRFWSRYGQNNLPDELTLETIRENLDGLENISGERIWVELKKILDHYPALSTVKLMLELNLFEHIGVETPIDRERVINDLRIAEDHVHTYSKKPQIPYLKKTLLPTIIFSTISENEAAVLIAHQTLKFSNLERDTLLYIVKNRNTNSVSIRDLKRELVKNNQSTEDQSRSKLSAFLVYKGEFELLETINNWKIPTFPITGREVTEEIIKRGIPKHRIKNILQDLRDEWALKDFEPTKDDLWNLMLNNLDDFKSTLQSRI